MRKVLSLTLIVVVACTALAEHPGIADDVVPEHAAAANHEDHDEHEVKPDLSMTEELLSHEEHEQTLVEHRSRVTPSVLIAADAISAELTSIKQSAKSDPVVAQIESTVLSMTNAMASPSCLAKDSSDKEVCKAKTTKNSCEGLLDAGSNKRCTFADTDGGTQDMDDRLNSAMNSINTAADTMLIGTKTDYDEAKVDLKALDDSIDISKKTISTTDLESIRTAATTWCAKKRALETATTDKQTAAATLNNKLNAPLGLTDLKLSEVGPIGAEDCSQDNGDDEALTSCPAYICSDDNLAQRIKEKIATGRAAYLTASWDKYNNNLAFGNATNENTAKKSVFQDKVTTTASTYHSMCHSDSSVHATAVTSFNANNANRASRYLSLGIIKCHINHMKSDQEYVFTPADLLKSASSNTATSSTDCIANLQTAANIKIALFPDASSNEASSKVCPTLSAYETDIRNYGSLGFDKDESDWSPTSARCNAVTSHAVTPPPPPPVCGRKFSGRTELQKAVDLWIYNKHHALTAYYEEQALKAYDGCHISTWDTSLVTSMSGLFAYRKSFNDDISNWDTSNVLTLRVLFYNAEAFNQDIGKWDTSKVTDISNLFFGAKAFNADISKWDTSQVTNMASCFNRASVFNQDISNWDVRKVHTLSSMFSRAFAFNQDLSTWDVSKVNLVSMLWMFHKGSSMIPPWCTGNCAA